jgi:hypothetical protein
MSFVDSACWRTTWADKDHTPATLRMGSGNDLQGAQHITLVAEILRCIPKTHLTYRKESRISICGNPIVFISRRIRIYPHGYAGSMPRTILGSLMLSPRFVNPRSCIVPGIAFVHEQLPSVSFSDRDFVK